MHALTQELQEAESKLTARKNALDQCEAEKARMQLALEQAGVPVPPPAAAAVEGGGAIDSAGAMGVLESQLAQIKELSDLLEEARRQGFDTESTGAHDGCEDDGGADDVNMCGGDEGILGSGMDMDMGMGSAAYEAAAATHMAQNEAERKEQLRIGDEKDKELECLNTAMQTKQVWKSMIWH
jgi:hypothetical protein